jgi:hypothetical protein
MWPSAQRGMEMGVKVREKPQGLGIWWTSMAMRSRQAIGMQSISLIRNHPQPCHNQSKKKGHNPLGLRPFFFRGAEAGTRTPTGVRPLDPESNFNAQAGISRDVQGTKKVQ